MLIVGITGGIASGKTTVTAKLTELGAASVDADQVAHEKMAAGTGVHSRLVGRFGEDILLPDSEIDRRRLAEIVFADPEQLRALNAIVHPPVVAEIAGIVDQWRADAHHEIGVVQAPLLLESGLFDVVDLVVMVVASPEQQLSRLEARGLSTDDAVARLQAQPPDYVRLAVADLTLINKGTLELLSEQVRILDCKLRQA